MKYLRRQTLRAILVAVSLCASVNPVMAYLSPEEAFGIGSSSASFASNASAASSVYSSYPATVPHAAASSQPPVTLIYSSPVSRRLLEEQVASREAEQRKNNAYYYSPQFTDPSYQPPVISSSASSVAAAASQPCSFYDANCLYQERRAAMANQPNVIVINGNNVYDSQGRVLHSGAPGVTASGPADIVFASVLLLAAMATLYTVWRERKILHSR